MTRLHWALLVPYLTLAAAFGGWRGPELGWGVWCLLLPPLAWGAVATLPRFRGAVPFRAVAVMTGFGAAALGAGAVGIAWGVADATQRWSADPAVRAACGAALGFVGTGLTWLFAPSRPTDMAT